MARSPFEAPSLLIVCPFGLCCRRDSHRPAQSAHQSYFDSFSRTRRETFFPSHPFFPFSFPILLLLISAGTVRTTLGGIDFLRPGLAANQVHLSRKEEKEKDIQKRLHKNIWSNLKKPAHHSLFGTPAYPIPFRASPSRA